MTSSIPPPPFTDVGADAPGLVDELIDGLADLEPGADHSVGDASAVAEAEYHVAFEEARTSALARDALRVEIGGKPVTIGPGESFVVGRTGDHQVEHAMVSRQHLGLAFRRGALWVGDVGSANGSWVVRGDVRTRLGDNLIKVVPGDRVVTIGEVELLRVLEDRR